MKEEARFFLLKFQVGTESESFSQNYQMNFLALKLNLINLVLPKQSLNTHNVPFKDPLMAIAHWNLHSDMLVAGWWRVIGC